MSEADSTEQRKQESTLNDLLCDNGDNKFFIAVTSKYIVFDSEWEELTAVINKALSSHRAGAFTNVIAAVTPVA